MSAHAAPANGRDAFRDVSVVIVTLNGRRHLERCLRALAEQRGVEFETILVDNASTDDSVSFVRKAFPRARVVAETRNLGFAGGNNSGFRASSRPYVAFLNNDTEPAPDWLLALRRAFDAQPWAGFVTSRLVYMHDRSIIDSAGDGLTRAGGAYKRGHGQPADRFLRSCEVFGACGAAFMIRREVFEELGGFDEDFFLSHEDVDLSYRARLRGYRCWYAADAVVAHTGSGTLGRVSRQAVFHGQRNLEWVYLKNTPAVLLLRTLPGHCVYTLAAAAYFTWIGYAGAFLRAKWSALVGLPAIWRKRRAVQRSRRAATADLWRLLEPRWLRLKYREERFDLKIAESP